MSSLREILNANELASSWPRDDTGTREMGENKRKTGTRIGAVYLIWVEAPDATLTWRGTIRP
jgi:hypothetical protein